MYVLEPPVNVCPRVPTQLIYAPLLYYYKKGWGGIEYPPLRFFHQCSFSPASGYEGTRSFRQVQKHSYIYFS